MKVVATRHPDIIDGLEAGVIPVLVHAPRGSHQGSGTIGHGVIEAVRQLPNRPSKTAFDFLTIALSVIASDTFVRRDDAPDGWTRTIDLRIEVANPKVWKPLAGSLQQALGFLTGDRWRLRFDPDGPVCPDVQSKLSGEDCACLFSGGLDSMLGAIELKAKGNHPLLVSQSYPKEGGIQTALAKAFGMEINHFAANADPRFNGTNDTSMRARSLLFIAYGVIAASALAKSTAASPIDLYIPENGFIALNAPLTLRRIGSHSTRTTHPYFLDAIRQILKAADLPVNLTNPFEFMTKGEMMRQSPQKALLKANASETASCGKWKRTGIQCGRCLPCIIRRAAFHASGIADTTHYRFPDLVAVAKNPYEHDDLFALRVAARRLKTGDLDSWVSRGGPLSEDQATRQQQLDVFRRGLNEVSSYLTHVGCPP